MNGGPPTKWKAHAEHDRRRQPAPWNGGVGEVEDEHPDADVALFRGWSEYLAETRVRFGEEMGLTGYMEGLIRSGKRVAVEIGKQA